MKMRVLGFAVLAIMLCGLVGCNHGQEITGTSVLKDGTEVTTITSWDNNPFTHNVKTQNVFMKKPPVCEPQAQQAQVQPPANCPAPAPQQQLTPQAPPPTVYPSLAAQAPYASYYNRQPAVPVFYNPQPAVATASPPVQPAVTNPGWEHINSNNVGGAGIVNNASSNAIGLGAVGWGLSKVRMNGGGSSSSSAAASSSAR